MKTLIIDDEPLAREGMTEYVNQVDFLKWAGTAKDALDALKLMQKQSVDLLLLDVNMPKLSGIDFLKTLDKPPLVILTTAYPSFALEGYQLNVLDYLVKPITFSRFLAAALKAKKQFDLMKGSKPAVVTSSPSDAHFFIKSDGKAEKILLSELLFVEAMQNYIQLYTERGKFTTLMPMKNMATELPEPRFFRVHKSYIVHLQKVQTIDGHQLLIDQYKIPVSRSKLAQVNELILGGKLIS
ncbi:MAG: LytTR family DNA-binding domain-containing protein [Bacteroidota bacterium]